MLSKFKQLKQIRQFMQQEKGAIALDELIILPCPFCGSDKVLIKHDNIDGWVSYLCCGGDCDDMVGPMSKFKYEDKDEATKDAINQWNHRK